MKINSKKHSSELIKMLNLNRVPEIVCTQYNKAEIREFCENYVEKTYILRDVVNPSGKYYLCKNVEECVNNALNYEGAFSLAVSCFAYENIVLLGEVLLTKDNITIVASNDKTTHHRNVYQKATINTTTTLDDKKLWRVKGADQIIKYVAENNLYDVIVEFVVYDKNVGVNNDKVLIVELRSDY